MGSILVTQEGVEIINIDKSNRVQAILELLEFFKMQNEAHNYRDSFYMRESAYSHKYSYGAYYPAFVHLSWEEFSSLPVFKDIDFNTYNSIVNAFNLRFPRIISDERDFQEFIEPRGEGGFEHADSPEDFLCNISRWCGWHRDHLKEHTEMIDWSENEFLPNQKAIFEIIEEEITKYIERIYEERINSAANKVFEKAKIRKELFSDSQFHVDGNKDKPLKKNAPILFLHRVIIPSLEHEAMAAYCIEVGNKICKENYYTFEQSLSSREQQATGAMRNIWSIQKNSRIQYISFDFHKGMFEFHNHKGEHLGEYHFDGTINSRAKADHNLKTINK